MKKIFFFIFAFLAVIPMLSAVEINMNQNFNQGETLIANITGIFLQDIRSDNLILYRDYHIRVPTQFEIYKIDSNNYYVYAQLLDKPEGNYSLVLSQIQYNQAGKIIQGDIWENFTITNNTADFYVNPGFVASSEDFSIELVNYQGTSLEVEETIINSSLQNSSSGEFFSSLFGTSSSSSSSNVITLLPGEIKSVDFKISDFANPSFIQLVSNNTQYDIPVTVLGNSVEAQGIYFDVSDLDVSMSTDSNTSRIIYLKNSGNSNIENISIIVSDSIKDYVNISQSEIESINANSTAVIYLNFSSGDTEFSTNGSIEAQSSGGFSDTLPVSINAIEGYVPTPEENSSLNTTTSYSETCSDLGGEICTSSQVCNSTTTDAKDGKCCINNDCVDNPPGSGGKIIGWIIVILVVIFLAWFYLKKYKKPRKPVNVLEVSKMLTKMQKKIKE